MWLGIWVPGKGLRKVTFPELVQMAGAILGCLGGIHFDIARDHTLFFLLGATCSSYSAGRKKQK